MRNRVLTAVAAFSAVLAACDGSRSATASDARLSAADAASLNAALFSTAAGFSHGTVPTGTRGARIATSTAAGTVSYSFNTTQPCSTGGNVGLSGTLAAGFDAAAQTAQVQANVAVVHQACAVKTQQGATFTLNGAPKIDVVLNAAASAAGVTALHATEIGAFDWTSSGSSGHCDVNVTADLVSGTQNVKLSGTFCGFPVDQTVTANG